MCTHIHVYYLYCTICVHMYSMYVCSMNVRCTPVHVKYCPHEKTEIQSLLNISSPLRHPPATSKQFLSCLHPTCHVHLESKHHVHRRQFSETIFVSLDCVTIQSLRSCQQSLCSALSTDCHKKKHLLYHRFHPNFDRDFDASYEVISIVAPVFGIPKLT